jgi:hypothetical protein
MAGTLAQNYLPSLPDWAVNADGSYNTARYPNPTNLADPINTSYVNWLQQNFQRAEPMPTQPSTGYPTPDYIRSSLTNPVPTQPPSTVQSSITSQMPATQAAAQLASTSTYNSANPNPTQVPEGDVWDGFARRYAPGQRDLLFSQQGPGIVLRDYLNQDGRNNYINMEGDMSRYAQVAPEIYDLLMSGSNNPDVTGDDDVINFMAKLFQGQTTEGGQSPTLQQLLGGFYAGLNNEDSGLYTEVNIGDDGLPVNTSQQIANVNRMVPYLNTFSGNYRYTDRMKKEAARLGQEYASRVANGDAAGQTYAQYLQQHFLR